MEEGQCCEWFVSEAAAAAAKSLQPCPTLCDPIDRSPPGSSVPGILPAGVLEVGAIARSVSAKQALASFEWPGLTAPGFRAALFIIDKKWKQPKCPSTDEWIKKMWYIHTIEYYSNIKKSKIFSSTAAWMDLEIITLSEVSQAEKDILYNITFIWNLKNNKYFNFYI